jgi:hypothetical protein
MSAQLKLIAAAFLASQLVACPVHSHARVTLTAEEREVVEWFRTDEWLRSDEPAIQYAYSLTRTLLVEELVRRRLLMIRCTQRYLFMDADRLLNPGYRALVDQATGAVQAHLRDKDYDARDLGSSLAGSLFAFRKADESTRQAWLSYMKTSDAREARDWRLKLVLFDEFHDRYAFDQNTGALHGGWLHWFGDYLRAAGLFEAFVKSADSSWPGLGEEFSAFTRRPLSSPLQRSERAELQRLSNQLKTAHDAIVEALIHSLPERTARLLDEWDAQPMAQGLESAHERIRKVQRSGVFDVAGRRLTAGDPEIEDFLFRQLGNLDDRMRREDAVTAVVRKIVEGECATQTGREPK